MNEKMLNIVLLIFTFVLCIFIHYYMSVERWDNGFQTSVYGLTHIQDFDYCKNTQSKVISYYECSIPYGRLPLPRILKTFPSAKIINWACISDCFADSSDEKIQIRGCTSGEYFCLFANNHVKS